MSFLSLIFWIVVIGVVVWLLQRAPFLDPPFKKIILWVGIIAAVFLVLSAFGILRMFDFQLPTLHK